MTKALKELLEKVEAGEGLSIGDAGGALREPIQILSVVGAYRGSLNDAKALHEALLPGWSVDDMSQNGRIAGHPWGIRIEKWDGRFGGAVASASAGWGGDITPSDNPARAWLIAILKAKIAESEDE